MIRFAPTDDALYATLRGTCGVEGWCSRSCEELGEHVLIPIPDPHEIYDEVVARARVELPELLAATEGAHHGQ